MAKAVIVRTVVRRWWELRARIGHPAECGEERLGLRQFDGQHPIAATGCAARHSGGSMASGPRKRTAASGGGSGLSQTLFKPTPGS